MLLEDKDKNRLEKTEPGTEFYACSLFFHLLQQPSSISFRIRPRHKKRDLKQQPGPDLMRLVLGVGYALSWKTICCFNSCFLNFSLQMMSYYVLPVRLSVHTNE